MQLNAFRSLFHHNRKGLFTKTIQIMKLTTVLLIVACLHASAGSYAQKINISVKNTSLQKVFKAVTKQTGYQFLFADEFLNTTKNVSFVINNATIEQVLDSCFKAQPLDYTIDDKTIIIKRKREVITTPFLQSPVIEVTGKITDQNGVALVGATIMIKGSNSGTHSDAKGNFSLTGIGNQDILLISFIGYETAEEKVNGRSKINVALKLVNTIGEQVIMVGYGSQKKKDVTGAITVISSKELEDRPNTQFGYAIEGKAAGVQVIRPSGQPQAGFSIRIRGTSTITAGSEPLYIVDGVPTESTNEINPADIESLTILKDASAAAIYGSSGANGVVLITTKRGKNQKTKVSFDTYTGIAKVWKKIDVLNAAQYKTLMTDLGQSTDWSKYTADNNWQNQVFRTAHSKNYQLGVRGGNENTGYYISGSWVKQQGVVIDNDLNRASFKINLDHKINTHFKIGTSIAYSRWTDIDVSENSKYGSILSMLTGSPVTGIYNADGTFAINPFIPDLENPVALILKNKHQWHNYRFNGNIYAEATIAKDFKLRTMFGFEQLNGNYDAWVDPYTSREGRGFKGIADLTANQTSYWISENTLNYTKVLGQKHSISALAGFVASQKNISGSWIHGTGFGSDAIPNVSGASIKTSGASTTQRKNIAAISRINYGYDERYLLTANFRADASSVFNNTANVWGYFPSFSAGWRIAKERFFNTHGFINDLKLRVGWGEVGNDQVDDYASYGLVNASSNYVIGGVIANGTAAASLENRNLKWETTRQTDIGIDIAMLNNRILFTSDYYIKQTSDMLLNRPIPASVGIGSNTAIKNIGKMENRGIEFQVSSKNIIGALNWTTDFNISTNKSKIISLDGGTIKIGNISGRGAVAIAEEGKQLGLFYGYISDGVDPKTGNIKYRDLDKSGSLSDSDQTIIGNSNPKYAFGLTNSFSYKNFTFNFFFQGIQGNQIFNATRIETEGLLEPSNQTVNVLRRWKTPGQITDIPKVSFADNTNSLISSRYIEDGSFVRLKSATIGYDLPKTLLNKIKISRCFFYITGENILTFTKYTGFDPEVSLFGRGANSERNIAPGVDYGTYPQSREFIAGVNIVF